MTNRDEINAVAIPISRMAASMDVKWNPNWRTFKRLAPNMTGIARKKVNSAATVRDTPRRSAPTMVAPERDVPGKMAAIN